MPGWVASELITLRSRSNRRSAVGSVTSMSSIFSATRRPVDS